MNQIALHFQIVIYPSEGRDVGTFTAHCLNMDLVAADNTVEGAVDNLLESIEAAIEASHKHNTNPFRDAPREYWEKLAQGRPLSRELVERIIFNANKRHGGPKRLVDVESQCDIRQLQTA